MTAHKESKGEERRRILVGVQIDGDGRELLNWALTNVTTKGDRVVAVHVSRKSDLSDASIKELDGFLAEFETLCTTKHVTLVGRVSQGNSIKKSIVKEAQLCDATMVVVGSNTNCPFGLSIWSSTSVAKYCAKKLPPTTALIAFHNGKVFFERKSIEPPAGEELKISLGSILHHSVRMDTKAITPRLPKSSTVQKNQERWNDRRESSDMSSMLAIIKKSPKEKPGWPLLKRAMTANVEGLRESEDQKMSVVQWVMNLPNRSLLAIEAAPIDLTEELKNSCKWFQYEEIRSSTNQFSSENVIGKGASSQVYKGCLSDGQQVAIKKLSKQTSRDLLLEVEIITKLKHERIVPLIGICIDNKRFLSIYRYFSKGSLEENLHGKRVKSPLAWDKRFMIAVGVAEALSYLHNGCSRPVIHRDVKSSNILLNDEFEPQLSDFGLAIWAPTNSLFQTHKDVVGTFGYLAPEYFMYGKVSNKIDVYAYGVVLLELLTGRKPINDESPKGQESLVMWATPVLERGDLKEFLDPNLDGKYDENQLQRMILVASLCITRAARIRPQMSQVLSLLQGEEDIESWINSEADNSVKDVDSQDDETYPPSSVGSHLGLALLDVVDHEDASVVSFEQNHLGSLDDYLRERWSRSSSLD